MLQIALANLVASESAEIVGMDWQIELGSGNILWVEPSDEGFVYQIRYVSDDKEYYGDRKELTCVSQLQDLINEVD